MTCITVDYRSRKQLYEQIIDSVRQSILSGAITPGEKLPSVRNLAKELGINPNTIQKAYAILEKDGYLYSVRGKGMFVSASASLTESKRRDFCEKMTVLLDEGRGLGVPREVIEDLVARAYEEESDD